MRRPVGEESMALRRRVMKYGVAVVSPRVAIRSVRVFQSPPGQMGVGGVSFIYKILFFWGGGGGSSLEKGCFLEPPPHTHTTYLLV